LAIAGLGFFAALAASLALFGGATELGFPVMPRGEVDFTVLFGTGAGLTFAFVFAFFTHGLLRLFFATVFFAAVFTGAFAAVVAGAAATGFGPTST